MPDATGEQDRRSEAVVCEVARQSQTEVCRSSNWTQRTVTIMFGVALLGMDALLDRNAFA